MTATEWGKLIGIVRSPASRLLRTADESFQLSYERPFVLFEFMKALPDCFITVIQSRGELNFPNLADFLIAKEIFRVQSVESHHEKPKIQ